MKFTDVTGQEEIKQKLISSVKNGRISQALMFISPEGRGGLPLAIAFAQYLVCINKQENDSCGMCPPCHKMSKLIHPDIHFSFPVIKTNDKPISDDFISTWRTSVIENPYLGYFDWLEKMNAENKQGNISMAECHNIIKKISLKSFEGKFKILIQWLPEYLGKNGNSLLKILEEPPEGTLFLFVTQNKDLILNTIRSRTQQILLPPLKTNTIADQLISQFQLEKQNALKIAEMAAGNFSESIRLYQSGQNDHSIKFIEWLRLCWTNDGVDVFKWVQDFSSKGREYQKDFLQSGIRLIRENVLWNNKLPELNHLGDDEIEFSKNFSVLMNENRASKIYQLLDKSYYYVERNTNPKVLFFQLTLQLNQILTK